MTAFPWKYKRQLFANLFNTQEALKVFCTRNTRPEIPVTRGDTVEILCNIRKANGELIKNVWFIMSHGELAKLSKLLLKKEG